MIWVLLKILLCKKHRQLVACEGSKRLAHGFSGAVHEPEHRRVVRAKGQIVLMWRFVSSGRNSTTSKYSRPSSSLKDKGPLHIWQICGPAKRDGYRALRSAIRLS
jgi:hypothetical protein